MWQRIPRGLEVRQLTAALLRRRCRGCWGHRLHPHGDSQSPSGQAGELVGPPNSTATARDEDQRASVVRRAPSHFIPKILILSQEVLLAGLSAVSKSRWEADYRIAIFILLLDFIQVALFIMDPVFGWDIEWDGCGAHSP